MKTDHGNRRPVRRDELWDERIHDPYKARLKLADGTRCPACGAVYRQGRWVWGGDDSVRESTCPACQRIRDGLPAGYVSLGGDFARAHREEIRQLVHNREQREKAEHPLERIMAIEDRDDGLLVTTTDIHLARDIGEAVHAAYKGELDYRYNEGEILLRVRWIR